MRPHPGSFAGVLLAGLLSALPAWAQAGGRTGEQIYRDLCAKCHGPTGEGTKDNPDPLTGDRTLEKLAQYIDKNMPEGAPEKCVGEDARKVAEYIYNAFYSRAALARNKPPRAELSRLTVDQYRNSVADLVASLVPAARPDERRGLQAEYFNARRFQNDKRVAERIDPTLAFELGKSSPSEKLVAEEISARWSGGLLAPETGEYEINLESANGFRLWVNDAERALIDAWVRSGDQKAHRETVRLLAGRVYPLRVEFFKAKSEKAASVALKWKRPDRVEEIVPERYLSPGRFAEAMVVQAAFPPDDRSMGYERSSSISKAWDEAATQAALEAAAFVASRRAALAGGRTDAPGLRDLGRRFAERAFRRPLTPELQAFFVDRHFEGGADLEMALKKVVLLVLKSPRFLYPETGFEGADAHAVASRLALGLWDSLPDAALLEAARSGGLASREGVVRQIDRMMADPRARSKVREFYHRWLQLDRLHDLTKDVKRFPEFTEAIVSDLRTSLDLFLDDVTWSEASDFRQLLLADSVFLNGRLAKFYGADLPADAPFQKVPLGSDKHAGILTHPLLMAGFAYDSTTSPIHRGVFIARSLLGKRLRPPPEAVTPLDPELNPEMNTRERIALQTRAQTCQSCHAMINPLGFALEHYDAVGRFRGEEKGRPIDATGSYATTTGDAVRFKGGRELGEFLARSEEAQAAFIEHLFQFLVKQPVRAYGPDRPEILRADFAKNAFSIRKLLVDQISASALSGPRTVKGKSP